MPQMSTKAGSRRDVENLLARKGTNEAQVVSGSGRVE